ncbi:spore coat protein H [Natronincola peptidivorans]|uniref:Spore coat protein H n=1 Tax=Natronincola peptidivorans TaxID=426128 RepID=A0A1I0CUH0_9FIRM|nr:CotH kinase family protein [Natronincola peptidivorans]SET22939.1 spore coat protein H [Natronincola peptidivorans]
MKRIGLIVLATMVGLLIFVSCRKEEKAVNDNDIEVNSIYIYMEEEDLQELYSRDPFSDDRIDAFARISEEEMDLQPIEIRFRGHSTRMLPKKSFNIRFEEGQELLFGSDRMNLNGSYTDPSQMREKLSMDMFHHIGLPAPRTKYFNLYMNDIYEGLFIHVERIDENVLANMGVNQEGTLIRDRFVRNQDEEEIDRGSLFGYDIASVEDPITLLEENLDYRGTPSWEAVIDLTKWVYDTPAGDDFYHGFLEHFYWQQYIDWLAIHILIGDIDSYGDDYWLYKDHENPQEKWRIIPWDKDLTFGSTYRPEEYVDNHFFAYEYHMTRYNYSRNEIFNKFMETPALREKLFQRMDYLMKEVFHLGYFEAEVENTKRLIEESANKAPGANAFLLHPQNHHGELGYYAYHLETLLDFIELRYQYLQQHMLQHQEIKRYEAKVDLSKYREGDTLYFTDNNGWTMAKLLIEEINQIGSIEMKVREEEGIQGINRIWEINAGNASVAGEITLYYRNDVAHFGRANWYEEDTAVGNQWDLIIAQYNSGEMETLPSRVNPYSNKVSAKAAISNAMELVITYP